MNREQRLQALRYFGFFISVLIFAVAAYYMRQSLDQISVEAFREFMGSVGWRGILIMMAVFCVASALFVPSMPMGVAAALVLGPWDGLVVLQISTLLAAGFTFALVRLWFRPLLGAQTFTSLIPSQILERVDNNAMLLIVYGRTLKLPAPAINYGASSLNISFKDYMLASFLGSFPNNVLVAMLCGVAHKAFLEGSWLALLRWELIPAVAITFLNVWLAHVINGRSKADLAIDSSEV